MSAVDPRHAWKAALRRQAEAARAGQPDKDALSRRIWQRFSALPEYAAAGTVMLYVHTGDEVRTQPFFPGVWGDGKRIVVPYCRRGELELFLLESLDELAFGTYGILEPRMELRALTGRRPALEEIDLVLVPGVAFGRQGQRLGHGKGYYDRLLAKASPRTTLVGAAFECQVLDDVPMLARDVFMDLIVTETATYPGRRRLER